MLERDVPGANRRVGNVQSGAARCIDNVAGPSDVDRAAASSEEAGAARGVNVQSAAREVDGGAGIVGQVDGVRRAAVKDAVQCGEQDCSGSVAVEEDGRAVAARMTENAG